MLKVQFDDDVLRVRPEGPITREDVAALTRAADEYLTGHPKITGVMVETRTFPASRPEVTERSAGTHKRTKPERRDAVVQ